MSEPSLLERINSLPQTDDKIDPHILRARQSHARSYIDWSEEEDQILISLEKNYSRNYICRQLKRSRSAIETRIKILNATSKTTEPVIKNNEASTTIENKQKLSSTLSENEIKQVLQYWRNSLADADKMGLSPEKMKRGEEFTLENFKSGQLSPQKIKRFFDDAEKEMRKKNKYQSKFQKEEKEENVIKKISVLIAPYTIAKNYEHGKKMGWERGPRNLFPLWIVAELTQEGKLIPSEELSYPWIERKCLTPNETYLDSLGFPIIGDVTQVDKFYTKNMDLFSEEKKTWAALFSYAQDLFFSLTKEKSDILIKQNFLLLEKGYILPVKDVMDTTKNLITTYDQYISGSDKNIPKILKHFCTLTNDKPLSDLPIETIFTTSLNHLAQVQQQYSLAASQRISLSYFSTIENNSIFTIHGPPGTGKTTLLLSIIASKWVEAAIQKQSAPILVATSTNNLAILNILDQFKKIGQRNSKELSIRWLPDFDSYGLYLAPSHKAKEAEEKGYPYRLIKSNFNSLDFMYEEEYKIQSIAYFLSHYNAYYQKNETDIASCQKFIHEQMLAKNALLKEIIHFSKEFYCFIQKYGDIKKLNKSISDKELQKTLIKEKLENIKTIQLNWLQFKTTQLKWPTIFKWLRVGKTLLNDRIKLFANQYSEIGFTSSHSLEEIEQILKENFLKEEGAFKQIKKEIDQLTLLKKEYKHFYKDKEILENQLGLQISIKDIFDFNSPDNILCKLDKTLRYELFILATHYWEASWLLENAVLNSLRSNFDGRKKFWQIQAMLTPCFVTTLHSGPAFFQYKAPSQSFEILSDFIDLLIIDEAGQVMPAIAAPMISIAKKVLLVGDDKQIEPIYTLTEGIDLANTRKYKICQDEHDYEKMKKIGILCSGDSETTHAYGNLIVLGQQKAKYHLNGHLLPGMLLTEHRRCATEIISYCNTLCYNNQLQVFTAEKPSLYPRMGYAHIKGCEEKHGSSRFNKVEAETIVAWLLKNEEKIVTSCEKENLNQCVGIITPYARQGHILKDLIYQEKLSIEKVGTIHSLQGAEKPIIIFSPVCVSDEKQNTYFFDKSPNMLNVAVSRAERSFLVFGDMDIFDPNKGNLPSSLLGKYLFAKEENEIVDIIQPKFDTLKGEEDDKIWQVNTLEQHQYVLRRAFRRTERELNIVSPFLKIRAIESDDIANLIKQYSLKITVNIYTDPSLNKNTLQEFNHAKSILKKAGASVYLVKNVHSKIITVDNGIIIEGSFNWLSASRKPEFANEESSIIYSGKKAALFIQKAIEPLKAKIIHS